MNARATVTSKGQVTIPAALRARLELEAGDQLVFIVRDDGTVLLEKDTRSFNDLKGIVKIDRPVSTDEINAWIGAARTAIGSSR